MGTGGRRKVAVEPGGVRGWLADAVVAGGAEVVPPDEASGIVWTRHDDPASLATLLEHQPGLRWVQLPWAGIEPYVDIVRAHPDRDWACGKGVYAGPVAEHALGLALAGMRNLHSYARATTWTAPAGVNLIGASVVVLGGGGIAEAFLRLLQPFDCDVTVVRRTVAAMHGATRVVQLDRVDEALEGAALVVVALALTPETTGLLDRRRLELLAPHAWVVNVGRGAHIVTDDLAEVLAEGRIGGAALDVTDPEPLPDSHPLWSEGRCIVTPHTANTPEMAVPLLGARVTENVRRWIAGERLVGPVDVEAGY